MGIIFGLLFTGIGLFLLVRGFIDFRTSKASRNWPSVEGQVVVATVEMKVGTVNYFKDIEKKNLNPTKVLKGK